MFGALLVAGAALIAARLNSAFVLALVAYAGNNGLVAKDARKAFHPFSEASVALAQALRRSDKEFSNVKVFRCPMTKDAFPGAPNRADWIQLTPEVHNPWFGKEMLDCGSEVKP